MNRKNALRHILKKCKKAKTFEDYCKIDKLLYDNGLSEIFRNRCDNCELDDFGICLLNADIYDGYAELNYCLPALIEKLENELQRSGNNG